MKNARFPIYRFQEIKKLDPYWSSYTCFCETIKDTPNISKRTLKRYFDLLVDKSDYARNEKAQILKYLEKTFLEKR